MDLHLVHGPQPITTPSQEEEALLVQTRALILKMLLDAKNKRVEWPGIDHRRTGRVIYVDGARGTGKTSFMLTMLVAWAKLHGEKALESDADWNKRIDGLHRLTPILDFDPLPEGLPLHAWLLQPWRSILGFRESCENDERNLEEELNDLTDRAIAGWADTKTQALTGAARTIALNDQVLGFVETRKRWETFVDAVVCRHANCREQHCTGGHQHLFVVAIDDVDLQVQEQASLLHAVRLLHHPNVLYILNGDYNHTRHVIELDYRARHVRVLSPCPIEPTARAKIDRDSRKLRDGLLDKSVPRQSRIHLEELTAASVLDFRVSAEAAIRDFLNEDVALLFGHHASDKGRQKGSPTDPASGLRVATARQVQHASGAFEGMTPVALSERTQGPGLAFLANLTGGSVEETPIPKLDLRGEISTRLGRLRRQWIGYPLTLVLAEQPALSFRPAHDSGVTPNANAVFLVQRAVDKKLVIAPGLVWQPVAGILATRVSWATVESDGGEALFHWPWLIRPTSDMFLTFHNLVDAIAKAVSDTPSLRELGPAILIEWVRWNVQHWSKAKTSARHSPDALKKLLGQGPGAGDNGAATWIANLLRAVTGNTGEEEEASRFRMELLFLAAPYMGLSEGIRLALWRSLRPTVDVPTRVEEDLAIKNAILASRSRLPRARRVVTEFEVKSFRDAATRLTGGRAWWDSSGEIAPGPGATPFRGEGKPGGAATETRDRRP